MIPNMDPPAAFVYVKQTLVLRGLKSSEEPPGGNEGSEGSEQKTG